MLNNQIISLVGLGKMGLGVYNRLYNENLNVHGYDINHDIIKNNTHINFLEIEKLLEFSDIVLFAVPSNDQIFNIVKSNTIKNNSIFFSL